MLEAAGKVRPAQTPSDARIIFSCGTPMKGVELRIINPDSCKPCDEGTVGEIWLQSACVTAGYYNKPALNAHVFQVQAHFLAFKANSIYSVQPNSNENTF